MRIRITECPEGHNSVETGLRIYVAGYSRHGKTESCYMRAGKVEPFSRGKVRISGLRNMPGCKVFYASIDGYQIPYMIIDRNGKPVVAKQRQDTICLSVEPDTANGWLLDTTKEAIWSGARDDRAYFRATMRAR